MKRNNKSYSELLRHPKWQKKRLEVLKRDGFMCQNCNDKESTLNIHHITYIGEKPWDTPNEFLVALCENCHKNFHDYKDDEILSLMVFYMKLNRITSILKRKKIILDKNILFDLCVYVPEIIIKKLVSLKDVNLDKIIASTIQYGKDCATE